MLTEPGRVTPTPTPLATTPNQYILPKKESLEKEEEETDEWMWYPCDFIINEIIDGEKVFRSLKPSVELVSDRQPERTINIALKVTMEKDFEHNDEEGWAWHKSWIIPTIKVSVITSTGRKANQLFPSSAFFQIRVVKASCKNPDRMFLLNVGVQGISTIAASTGSAVFQGLKFLTTSYKNEGSRFNLVIALKYTQPGQSHPEIIQSVISPPIFVDSRTNPKTFEGKNEGQKGEFGDFSPSKLRETLVKRVKDQEEEISDTLEGLVNYLTAPNIRNKIRNPFFLAIRFSSALRLYYNTLLVSKMENVVEVCIGKLRSSVTEDRSKSKKERKSIEGVTQRTLLCVVIEGDQSLVREATSKLGSNLLVQFCHSTTPLPPSFQHIEPSAVQSQYSSYLSVKINEEEANEAEMTQERGKEEQFVFRLLPQKSLEAPSVIQIYSNDNKSLLCEKPVSKLDSSLRQAGIRHLNSSTTPSFPPSLSVTRCNSLPSPRKPKQPQGINVESSDEESEAKKEMK